MEGARSHRPHARRSHIKLAVDNMVVAITLGYEHLDRASDQLLAVITEEALDLTVGEDEPVSSITTTASGADSMKPRNDRRSFGRSPTNSSRLKVRTSDQSVPFLGASDLSHTAWPSPARKAKIWASESSAKIRPPPTTGAEVMRRIDQAKRDGVAVADRELDVDVVAVACPVFSRGTVAAAVTVAGPEFRVRGHLRAVQQAVRRAAQALST